MSNSVRPHRRQPTRRPHPWDSPGKNTGVGCHFLLQCMKVKSESEIDQLYPTIRDPMDCSLPGSSIHGIFQARVLEWDAIAFSTHIVYVYIFRCDRYTESCQLQLHLGFLGGFINTFKVLYVNLSSFLHEVGVKGKAENN